MSVPATAYGFWSLALVSVIIYSLLVVSFFRPQAPADWRTFVLFSSYLAAIFSEMYGFPLSLYMFSDWLQTRYPQIDWLSHDTGHLLDLLIGWQADPHLGPFHLFGFLLMAIGFTVMFSAAQELRTAARRHVPATTGAYAYVRHPQYIAFVLIMLGFVLQWPTPLNLALLLLFIPIFVRLARAEEREASAKFGARYRSYMNRVPGFIPKRTG